MKGKAALRRTINIAAAAAAAIGLALVALVWGLSGGGGSVVWAQDGLRAYRNADSVVLMTQRNLSDVTAIFVDAASADVEFVAADSFGFEVKTLDGEPEWSLENGVLRVSEHASGTVSLWALNLDAGNSPHITIFCPSGAVLDQLNVKSVSGTIRANGPISEVRRSVEISTGSGGIQLDALKTKQLNLATVSGSVESQGVSADSAQVGTGSGKIEFRDFAGYLDANSTSGGIAISGDYTGGTLESGSGRIQLTTSQPLERFNYRLETGSGGIRVNGAEVGNPAISDSPGGSELSAKSVSGSIDIEFAR
ncbi:MAG: DUF4097 domain-containing protein [Propionibacteriaceae bacterium]|jgi:hypothetical protein|nr:DUF4097 domain-containing protein [Propionibacteriaceae bacterium]